MTRVTCAKDISNGIKRLREWKKLTQAEFAIQLGMRQQHIARMEARDKVYTSIPVLIRIAEKLGCDLFFEFKIRQAVGKKGGGMNRKVVRDVYSQDFIDE